MVRCCLAYAVIVVYSAAAPYSFAQAEPRAVIELFTSQGCSSCPPADQLLGELADDPSLVSVSVPVDYWDYLGWKDTLADPRNTARQKAYAHARGDGQVYTPQVVVNGTLHALGSDKAAIELAIAASLKNGAMSLVPTLALAESTLRAAGSLAELVLVDAPVLADERALALASRAERVLVLSYDDPLSLATLDGVDLPNAAWLVASQSRTARVGERAAFRALPRDEAAVGAALSGRRAAGGALGRAYDELAELIALDAS